MINRTMQPHQGAWYLSLSCLIDRLLDRIEELSTFVLPAKADNLPYGVEIEARLQQLGATYADTPRFSYRPPEHYQ